MALCSEKIGYNYSLTGQARGCVVASGVGPVQASIDAGVTRWHLTLSGGKFRASINASILIICVILCVEKINPFQSNLVLYLSVKWIYHPFWDSLLL